MGMCLDVAGICYSADHASDGFVPEVALPTLLAFATRRQHEQAAAKLVAVGRWQRDDDRGGWWIHDFLEYNPSAAELDEQRKDSAGRSRRWRAKRRSGDTSREQERDGVREHPRDVREQPPPRGLEKLKEQASLNHPVTGPSPDPTPAASPAGSSQAAADLAAEPQNNGQPPTDAQRAALRAALERNSRAALERRRQDADAEEVTEP
jgi:hypothetical protein